jgi:hypothetical protein
MANLTSTIFYDSELKAGGKKMTFGSWTAGSTGTGDIETGLQVVDNIVLTPNVNGAGVAKQTTVYETFPLNKGQVTIYTEGNISGYWSAIGY